MTNSQLNELKSEIKNGTGLTLKLSSNVVGDYNDDTNFSHKLLLTNTQVSSLRKDFANNSSANTKSSKTQLNKIRQSGGFSVRDLGPLLKSGLPLMKNVLKTLAKSVLTSISLTSAALVKEAAINKKMFGSGTTTLIISNEEINDVMKIVKSFEESGLLLKFVFERIKN